MEAVKQLGKPGVALCQPLALRRQRRSEKCELLIGREEAVADNRRRRDLEVDRPEQRLIELGLLTAQLARAGGGEPTVWTSPSALIAAPTR